MVPVFRNGQQVMPLPQLAESRERVAQQLGSLYDGTKRFDNPHEYPVGLEPALHAVREQMILEAREGGK